MIVFVTGATGLIGSNVCEQLIERGDEVRALARPGSETGPLRDMGVTIVEGDITDPVSVRKAADGCEAAVHAAAVLGGVVQDSSEHQQVNIGGVGNVLDAAEALGMRRIVTYGTTTYFEFKTAPLTERSPVDENPTTDPYTVTKVFPKLTFFEALELTAMPGKNACHEPSVYFISGRPAFVRKLPVTVAGSKSMPSL